MSEFDQIFALGEKNDAFAQYFIGQSYNAPLTAGSVPVSNITFEPGCRNNWHIHHGTDGGGDQILLCTAGSGWFQADGEQPTSMVPGTVIRVPTGTKHWHGAKADSWFSHLALITPGVDVRNEWLEPVTDEVYGALPTSCPLGPGPLPSAGPLRYHGGLMSRTVVAHQFHSLDGVVESPNLWQFGAFGADEGQLMGSVLGPVTDVVIGRVLWQEWSQFWSGSDDPFAQFINPVRKHVITSTLTGDLTWNSTVITDNPLDYVRGLKDSDGGEISVVGGIETIRTLFLGGVIDRLILTTHPVLAGSGRRLFDGAIPTTRLVLESAQPTDVGNVIMTYGLRPAD